MGWRCNFQLGEVSKSTQTMNIRYDKEKQTKTDDMMWMIQRFCVKRLKENQKMKDEWMNAVVCVCVCVYITFLWVVWISASLPGLSCGSRKTQTYKQLLFREQIQWFLYFCLFLVVCVCVCVDFHTFLWMVWISVSLTVHSFRGLKWRYR